MEGRADTKILATEDIVGQYKLPLALPPYGP
jgi:hypothetical protein